MHLSFSYFFLQRTVPLFQFHKMRVNGHMGYLLVRFAPDISTSKVCHEVSAESITTSCALQQIPIISYILHGVLTVRLNGRCGGAIITYVFGTPAAKT
jgi:hypothetical protein